MSRALSALLLFAAANCQADPPAPPAPIVITDVTVLPMTPDSVPLARATVTLENGRIASITAGTPAKLPAGARRIDGHGKWLMPGFTDMTCISRTTAWDACTSEIPRFRMAPLISRTH